MGDAGPVDALNEAQLRAATYGSGASHDRALLVVAGAGSGKTSTLAHRVAHLVRRGADVQRILLLTFSRRAALELERRVGRLLRTAVTIRDGDASPTLPWAGTFHAVGARILREYAPRIGLAPEFTIHDRGDSEDLMGLSRQQQLEREPAGKRFPSAATCVAIYSRVVNAEVALAAVLRGTFPWCAGWEEQLRRVFAGYVAEKQSQHVLDFDDLLLYWGAMAGIPEFAAELGARFDHVLVDEYQDTNALQGRIVRLLKPDGRGVTVVGDDAQAIYGFRAATVRNILEFAGQYDPPAEVVTLEQNYRSTEPILQASNAVIARASRRHAKNLRTDRRGGGRPRLVTVPDETSQANHVADQVLKHREEGIVLRCQAVLFRTSSHSATLEIELARRNIPFVKFGGLRFLDAAHVKDMLSLIRWIENPRSRVAGFRTLRLLPGVGPATARRWLDRLDGGGDARSAMRDFPVPAAASSEWESLRRALDAARDARADWPAELDPLQDWYRRQLERIYDDAASRIPDLVQLRRIAATYPSRERFLTELTLDPPAATSREACDPLLDDDYLTLSTIHSAKGREWNVVQVLNCIDGCIPSDMATGNAEELEEERRLLYVAMTRAKDHLALLMPLRFYVREQASLGDRHVYACASRFLSGDVRSHFDEETWALPTLGAASATSSGASVDLGARFRSAWVDGRQA